MKEFKVRNIENSIIQKLNKEAKLKSISREKLVKKIIEMHISISDENFKEFCNDFAFTKLKLLLKKHDESIIETLNLMLEEIKLRDDIILKTNKLLQKIIPIFDE